MSALTLGELRHIARQVKRRKGGKREIGEGRGKEGKGGEAKRGRGREGIVPPESVRPLRPY